MDKQLRVENGKVGAVAGSVGVGSVGTGEVGVGATGLRARVSVMVFFWMLSGVLWTGVVVADEDSGTPTTDEEQGFADELMVEAGMGVQAGSDAGGVSRVADDDMTSVQMLRDFGLVGDDGPGTSSGMAPGMTAMEPQRVIYDGAPLQVTLNVNRERRLVFDLPFEISIDAGVAELFSPEIYGRNLLLRALQPVRTRLRVRLIDGEVIPVDVYAVAGGAGEPTLEVVRQSVLDSRSVVSEQATVPEAALHGAAVGPGYIDLVRYAAQQLYAPARLRQSRSGVPTLNLHEVPVERRPVRLMRFSRVATQPIMSWMQAGLTVTAVRVTNRTGVSIHLDPRRIVGQWRAATFHHRRLPVGAETVLYLVSDRPFEQALGVHRFLSVADDATVMEVR